MTIALHRGHLMGLAAAVCWGLIPFYFKQLSSVGALEIVAHRILWSVPLLLGVLALRRALPELGVVLREPALRRWLLLSSVLIAANWLIYVWAVHADQIVAASLGYFISPLLSVVLGVLVFREKLTSVQWLAVCIAGVGVAVLAVSALSTLWVSLLLAGSWSAYSLVRKVAQVEPVTGLTVETGVLWLPFAVYLGWLVIAGGGAEFGNAAPAVNLLLIGGAAITAIPLLLFAGAVRTVSLSTLGLMQYIAPVMQFLTGVFVYHEPLTTGHLIAFGLIWSGLALYTIAALRGHAVATKPTAN